MLALRLFLVVALVCAPSAIHAKHAGPSSSSSISSTVGRSKLAEVDVRTQTRGKRDTADVLSSDSSSEGATIASSIFNLSKTILGAGVLALPSGMGGLSQNELGLIPGSILLALFGAISGYSFSSIGNSCRIHNTPSFAEAFAKSTGRPQFAKLLSSMITFKTFFACLAYSIIIGDSFSQILKTFGAPAYMYARTNVILGTTLFVLFPMCCLRKLDALKYTSLLGLAGTFYTAAFMTIRYFEGSYAPGGEFHSQIASNFQPFFTEYKPIGAEIFAFISMISAAYVAHYNAPKFWAELRRPTQKRYNTVIGVSFLVAAITYGLVMTVGFLTFGGNTAGLILNNYASKDMLATIARVSIGLGILFGYPLTFSPLRDGVMEVMGVPEYKREAATLPTTIAVLGVVTAIALVLKNVGFVVALGGALIGCMLVYTIPSMMNICNTKAAIARGEVSSTAGVQAVLALNYGLAAMGVVVAVIGATLVLKKG